MRGSGVVALVLLAAACSAPEGAEHAVAEPPQTVRPEPQAPDPEPSAGRRRRRADLTGRVDLGDLPADLQYTVDGVAVSGVVELERGRYDLVVLSDGEEIDRVPFAVREGALTHVAPFAVRRPNSMGGLVPPRWLAVRVIEAHPSYLSVHQRDDGTWGRGGCERRGCDAPGEESRDRVVAVTSLCLLSFLGAGETHQSGRYKTQVKSGLVYLEQVQTEDGWFAGPGPAGNRAHALAALAMAESYALTGSRLFERPAQRGVDALLAARGDLVAWSDERGAVDAETTVWAVFCLKSAAMSGLDLPTDAMAEARAALDVFGDPAAQTLSPREAAGLTIARVLTGADPRRDELTRSGVRRLAAAPPAHGGDPLYAYFGTLAMYQAGGSDWRDWSRSLADAVLDTMRLEEDAHERGSWDPLGAQAAALGRVPTTALHTLTLSIHYHYAAVFGVR